MNLFGLFSARSERMLVLSLCGFFVIFAALPLFAAARSAEAAQQSERTAVSAVNGLAVDLYRELSSDGANLCFSPYSISTAMAMTYAGARGDTALEMRRSLRYKADIHSSNRALREALMNIPQSAGELRVANSIWPGRDFRVLNAFNRVMRTEYASEVLPQDYKREPDRSRRSINDWVEDETRGKIKDILAQGAIRTDTKMVLVNAVYFKAPWMHEFDEGMTGDAEFYASSADRVSVRMMHKTDSFEYADFGGVQVLKLPYRQGVFSMLAILPKEREGLRAAEEGLSADEIARYQTKLERRRVNVFLPKFRVEQTFDLVSPLAALGVKSAFTPGAADFSGIGGKRDLHVNAVAHKAFVEVDEAGTEAAAATAVAMRTSAAYPGVTDEPVTFRADHPFLYIIQDDRSGAVLFMGKVEKP